MMASKSQGWIVACDGSNPEYPQGFACLRCGEKQPVPTPIPLEVYVFWGKYFARIHRQCKEVATIEPSAGSASETVNRQPSTPNAGGNE